MDDHSSMQRRLAAILAADIAGYSRLMGEDEAATVRDLKAHQAAVLPLVGRYGGRIIDTAGDGIRIGFLGTGTPTGWAPSQAETLAAPVSSDSPAVPPRASVGLDAGSELCAYGSSGGAVHLGDWRHRGEARGGMEAVAHSAGARVKEPFVSTTLPPLTDPLSALYLEGRDPRD
jgi:class 3 adenylate cyclase